MRHMLRALFLGLAFCAAAVFAVPADSLKLDAPVVDQAGVIAPEAERELNALLRGWHAQGLMQGAVVLVDSTDGMDVFDYAMQLGKRWQLGDKARDNGLLLLVAVNDRNLRIVTGSGIEGVLPDISAKKIIREDITPYFRNGNYAGGVRAGLEAAARRLQADPQVQAEMVAADRQTASSGPAGRTAPASAHPDVRLLGLLPIFFILIVAMNMLRRKSAVARGLSGLAAGGFAGIITWQITHVLLLALGMALYFGLAFSRSSDTHATRRRHRRDDDDGNDWFSGGFGGGFGGGGFGGGFGGSGGGYSGGGGSFSGGGAGGSW